MINVLDGRFTEPDRALGDRKRADVLAAAVADLQKSIERFRRQVARPQGSTTGPGHAFPLAHTDDSPFIAQGECGVTCGSGDSEND